MLYDEEGRAYVEPPLLPEDVNIKYVLDDYGRLFFENALLEKRNRKIRESSERLNSHLFSVRRINAVQRDVICSCIKLLKANGINLTPKIKEYRDNYLYKYKK